MNYLENLTILRDHLAQVPEINLKHYRALTDCGTLYCAAGWMPHITHFQRLGIVDSVGGAPRLEADLALRVRAEIDPYDQVDSIDLACNYLFGLFEGGHAHDYLFNSFGHGLWDRELLTDGMTDKELALARLDKAIEIRKAERTAQTLP
jgi:hypothetical protein